MRVLLILVVSLLVFCLISPIGAELSERRNEKKSFRLLERVKRQRKLEHQKLQRDKEMILKRAADREKKRSHSSSASSSSSSLSHSLETLSHGASYVSSLLSREEQLKSSKELSKLIKKHNKHQMESDHSELSSISHLLSLDKRKKHRKDNVNINTDSDDDMTKQKQREKQMEREQKRAERRLQRMEKEEKERREELLDGMNLGNTESVPLADETDRVFNQIVGNDKKMIDISVLLETNEKAEAKAKANPAWATKPEWWKVPPSEIGNAGSAPWPNDPLEQNGYPATIIDPNNYPLSNVDDPNNYPAIDDPNGAFAPIQQPQ